MNTHALLFIQDLAIVMLTAGIITVLCHRFKQPVVLGYILAGVIMGPYTPPFALIHDETTIKTLAELGVIFLMFSLGMEFDLHKLKKVGLVAVVAALSEIILMIWIGYEIGLMFRWSSIDAIFLGAILAISSTTIIIKALEELGMKRKKFAQLIFGILVIEDIFGIAILGLLSGIALSGSFEIKDIVITTLKLSSFLVISLIVGILFIPKILAYIAKFNNKEMLLISVLGICFGFCLLTVKLDYSVALGAFLIGTIVAESRQLEAIEELITPLRDMFSAIFFVSVGLLFNPAVLVDYILPIVVITIAVVVGKVLTCSFGTFITGRDPKTSMRVGMGLAQIGEFSFIIAALGVTLNVTSHFLFPIAVAVSIITTFLTPYLIKYSDPFIKYVYAITPERIVNIFEWYTLWLKNIRSEGKQSEVAKLVRLYIWQVIINLFIVVAIFFGSAYFSTTTWGETLIELLDERIQHTIIWSAALTCSLPFLIVIYRRIKAMSRALAGLNVKENINERFTLNVRRIIAEVIPIISLVGIMLVISALSASILPPLELLIVVSILMLGLAVLLYSWFLKLHAKLQISFLEAMKKNDTDKQI